MSTKKFTARNGIDANFNTITNVANPVESSDVATKDITDSITVIAQASFDAANTKFDSSGGSISGSIDLTGDLNVANSVGIGSPDHNYSTLTVNGPDWTSIGLYSSGSTLEGRLQFGPSNVILNAESNKELYISTIYEKSVIIATNNINRFQVSGTGNVSIGGLDFGHKLDVNGNINSSGSYKINGVDVISSTLNFSNLNASNLNSGIVSTARLASGTADSTTYLRGDQTWQPIQGGGQTSETISPFLLMGA